MSNRITGDKQKNLIEHKNGQIHGEFLSYIPGLLNWVLDMDESEATSIVKNYEVKVPSLLAMKARTLVETNPIADWLDNSIAYEAEARTNIGVAKRDKDSNSLTWYIDSEKWLYANYCEYCHHSGTHPVSLRRFVNLLSDLGQNQLGLDIRKGRDRLGSYFVGLKIKGINDSSPPMITGNSEVVINTKPEVKVELEPKPGNTNVINKMWTTVMDYVTDVMDSVMGESIASDECDGSDGKNEKSPELENNVKSKTACNTKNEEKEISSEFSKMPSHPSQEEAITETEQSATDDQVAITIGDKVEIDDCEGHWLWASPFTVSAIEGNMVKLEMVSELVEMSRLSRCKG